ASGNLILTGPGIDAWRLLALYHMLALEIAGMHHSSGRRASVEIRKVMGSQTMNRQQLHNQFAKWLREKGILSDVPKPRAARPSAGIR
ncbi:MAG: hypothetical protein ACREQ5_11430, partial [Candidatus Dormibacteria bacterium]